MGLDITKCKIVSALDLKSSSNYDMLVLDSSNRYLIELFDKYKEFVVNEEFEYVDWDKTLEKRVKNPEDYFLRLRSGGFARWAEKKDGLNEIEILSKDWHIFKKEVKVLYYTWIYDVNHRSIRANFYKDFYGKCWYEDTRSKIEKGQERYLISSQESFEEMKRYFIKKSDIHSLKLEENEFIFISC